MANSVLDQIFQKRKKRIFLGDLAVVPRETLGSKGEQWGVFENADLDAGLRTSLREIFTFPAIEEATNLRSDDLVLDIMIPDYQGGDFWGGELGELPLLFLWRPRVKLASRLYFWKTKKTVKTFVVTEKMALSYYFGRIFSWRGFARFKPLFDSEDLDYLLSRASHRLLKKIQRIV